MRPSELQLDLDAFAGPFDLLCTVLLRRELSLADVQLAEVVVGYVQHLAIQEKVDPDTASEFLVLVAALMEIKSRELLMVDEPLQIEEPAALEAQADMLARLIHYSTFKNAAAWLAERGSKPRYWRVASRPVIRRRATYNGPIIDPAMLQRSMQVLLAQPNVDVRHLVGKHASVHEMTGRLLSLLKERRIVSFESAVDGCSRLDQAVAFVAALELCKNGHVHLAQGELFGPISITHKDAMEGAGPFTEGIEKPKFFETKNKDGEHDDTESQIA